MSVDKPGLQDALGTAMSDPNRVLAGYGSQLVLHYLSRNQLYKSEILRTLQCC